MLNYYLFGVNLKLKKIATESFMYSDLKGKKQQYMTPYVAIASVLIWGFSYCYCKYRKMT